MVHKWGPCFIFWYSHLAHLSFMASYTEISSQLHSVKPLLVRHFSLLQAFSNYFCVASSLCSLCICWPSPLLCFVCISWCCIHFVAWLAWAESKCSLHFTITSLWLLWCTANGMLIGFRSLCLQSPCLFFENAEGACTFLFSTSLLNRVCMQVNFIGLVPMFVSEVLQTVMREKPANKRKSHQGCVQWSYL